MSKVNLYKYATLLLLFINVIVLCVFLFNRPKARPAGPGFIKASDHFELTEEQNETFLEFTKKHQEQMREIQRQQKERVKLYFDGLDTSTLAKNREQLIGEIQALEKDKIESVYQHFEDIKSLLTPEQMPKFDSFMRSAVDRILGGRPPRRRK